ncbi:MAG: 16S rRNA (adenine(1518)-N(6)/adenine(1519)-N(6))-dimethyltransferase RsmA [Limnobacter sp.]|nr:16S rRNA (adenine(1518)-N(6)/adenine(1519)-N(6))-dimethyltransferase RsmA [Limnobacter sp.]
MKHQARKRFGQHFLVDENVLSGIAQAIGPLPTDNLVEIGPGLGALTQWVLKYTGHLKVIELDRDLAQRLETGAWADKLTVYQSDVLKFDFSELGPQLRVVGNLPYNISSPILFKLLEHIDQVQDQTFMLQKEVIDRMVAQAGQKDFGRLSVMLQAYYDMEHLFDVPPEAFDPPPKVMSAIVQMVPKPDRLRDGIPHATLADLVTSAFSQRRKMLRNNWANKVSPEQARQVGIELTARAESISTEQYIELAQLLDQTANRET